MTMILDNLQFLRLGWTDFLEVGIVGFLLYRVLLVLQRTRAMQIILGLAILGSLYGLSRLLDLILIRTLLETAFQYGAIAALVVFQPELRVALARLGQSRMVRAFQRLEGSRAAEDIMEAVERLSKERRGAIICIEQEVGLGEYAESGSVVDAKVTADMISMIFAPHSPLHDGAVLIGGDRILTAGAILPLSQATMSDRSLGTRHRAALGLSEETDAIVLVVSEETSQISVARMGRLERSVPLERLRALLAGVDPAPKKTRMAGSTPVRQS